MLACMHSADSPLVEGTNANCHFYPAQNIVKTSEEILQTDIIVNK